MRIEPRAIWAQNKTMNTMLVANQEMLRANPHLRASKGEHYTAKVDGMKGAVALADKLGISYFELDGVFCGRTGRGWRRVG